MQSLRHPPTSAKWHVRQSKLVFGLCLCSIGAGLGVPDAGASNQSQPDAQGRIADKKALLRVTGTYASPDYGFTVRIPKGLVGSIPTAPLPQHGVRIQLSANGREFIWVVADYNAEDYSSPNQDIKENARWLRTEGTDLQTLAREQAELDGIGAERAQIRFRNKDTGAYMVEDFIAGLRHGGRGTTVLYELGMISLEDRYRKNKRIFDMVIDSWRATKIAQ